MSGAARSIIAAVVAAVVGAGVLGVPGAAGQTSIRTGASSGPLVPAGTGIRGDLTGSARLSLSSGDALCTSGDIGGTVGTNPSATSVPFSSPLLTLGSLANPCAGPPAPAAFRIFHLSLLGPSSGLLTTNAAGTGGTFTLAGLTLRASIAAPRTLSSPNGVCDFSASLANGVGQNADNSVAFTNVPIASATGFCAAAIAPTSSFSMKFLNLRTVSTGLRIYFGH